jgi:hypothetical protein
MLALSELLCKKNDRFSKSNQFLPPLVAVFIFVLNTTHKFLQPLVTVFWMGIKTLQAISRTIGASFSIHLKTVRNSLIFPILPCKIEVGKIYPYKSVRIKYESKRSVNNIIDIRT